MPHSEKFPEFYANAMHPFRDVTKVYVLARTNPEVLGSLVQEPLTAIPGDDRVLITWTRVGDMAGHPGMHYFDLRVPTSWGDLTAVHCGIEYIDSDAGLTCGRELWGYPKRGADFVWAETEDTVTAQSSRYGNLLGTVEFVADADAPTGEDVWPMTDFDIQVRSLPRIPGQKKYTEIVRADFFNVDVNRTTPGRVKVSLHDAGTHDPLAQFNNLEIVAARMTRLNFDFTQSALLDQFFD
jgi:acetoacetate decarboxylase